jgi:hypothetical protein
MTRSETPGGQRRTHSLREHTETTNTRSCHTECDSYKVYITPLRLSMLKLLCGYCSLWWFRRQPSKGVCLVEEMHKQYNKQECIYIPTKYHT